TVPVAPAVVTAIHAAMVLLIEATRRSLGHHEAVHALAVMGVVLSPRQEIGTRAPVAGLPGLAAVGRVEDAGGRDADPDLLVVLRMENERMQNHPAAARLPVGPRRVE